jgi:hypothetical protein
MRPHDFYSIKFHNLNTDDSFYQYQYTEKIPHKECRLERLA